MLAPTDIGYTGHVQDSSGLVYAQQRYYDPQIGRFMSTDPVRPYAGDPRYFGRYHYGANNPYKYTDPDGSALKVVKVAYNVVKKTYKNGGDLKKAAKEEGADFIENLAELADGDITEDDAIAVLDIALGIGDEIKDVKKTYQTYTKTHPETGKVYTGRTSGAGTPEENIANRDRSHHMNAEGYGPAVLDKTSPNKKAIRGREQQMIEANGGAASQGGTSGNAINGVSPNNPNRDTYMEESRREFGG